MKKSLCYQRVPGSPDIMHELQGLRGTNSIGKLANGWGKSGKNLPQAFLNGFLF